MKRYIILITLLLLVTTANVTTIKPVDQVTVAARTIYNDGNLALPDSVRIQVFRNGTELFDAWFNSADAEASAIDGWLFFTDQLQDIDGAGGIGAYIILGRAYDFDSSLFTPWIYSYDVGLFDSLTDIHGTVEDVEDTTNAIKDSTDLYIDATISSRSTYDPSTDSVIQDVSAANEAGGLVEIQTEDTWDELLTGATHNINNSAGKILRQIKGGSLIHDGTSDNVPANGANSFSLETGGGFPTTSTIDNFYNHYVLALVEGTGSPQNVLISDYNGTNQTATVTPAFFTIPDATTIYEIIPGLVHAETQGGGYAGGAIWVSPNGTAGTQLYVNGTIDNPIDDGSFADAKTVADALNMTIFRLENGSEITLATTYNNYTFTGTDWHLALGGQDLGHSVFMGAEVTGIATGANLIEFFDCKFGAVQLPASAFFNCGFGLELGVNDSLLATGTGQYLFRSCYSLVSGTLTPVFSMGDAIGNTKFGFRKYEGGLELSEINSTGEDSISIEGFGNLVLNVTDIGGELVIRGNWTIDSTAGGSAVNLTRDAALSGVYLVGEYYAADTSNHNSVTDSYGKILADPNYMKADISALALEASLYDPTVDSVLLANRGELSKQFADSVLLYDITGSFPNGSLAKFLRDFGLTIIRSEASQGMSSGTSNHVILDAGASSTDGSYDPSRIVNTITGESTIILEYDGTTKVATLFRDLKTPFNDGDDFIIFSDAGFLETNEGRLRGATSNTATLNPLASAVDGTYDNQNLYICSGKGADEVHKIKSYNGTTKIAILYEAWHDQPNDSSGYVINPVGDGFETRFMDSLLANPIPVVPTDTTVSGEELAIKSDSLIYQGPSGTLTKEQIANEVVDSARVHPEIFFGPLNVGSGSNNVTIFSIDTSAIPDDTVSGIGVNVFNLTGTPEANGNTLSDGAFTFKLDLGNWLFTAGGNRIQYAFNDTNFTVVSAFDTFSVLGYEVLIPPPSNPDLATVFGNIFNFLGMGVPGVIVTMQLETSLNVTSTTSGITIGDNVAIDTTDANGLFSFDVIRSTIYDDSLKSLYHVEGKLNKIPTFVLDSLFVPATGNVDITDAINNR